MKTEQKTIDRMKKETKRALAHVALLEKLYLKSQKSKTK